MNPQKRDRMEFLENEIEYLKKGEFLTERAMKLGDSDGTMKAQLERVQKQRNSYEAELLILKPLKGKKRRAKRAK